jgi:hypothetical protein
MRATRPARYPRLCRPDGGADGGEHHQGEAADSGGQSRPKEKALEMLNKIIDIYKNGD